MDKISFKVYLMRESSANKLEVRRFNVEKNSNLTYAYIREKLQSIFPMLLDKNFVISWKDEIDDIIISSTEELQLALKEMGEYDVINRLYATIQNEHEEKDASGPTKIKPVSHPGVVCDVCDSNIHGFRFKCIQCPNYDLCMDCLTLGYHSEHYMVRMPEPLEWSSYQGRKLAHHMKKFMKKAAAVCKEDERKHGRRHCPAFSSGKLVFDPLELLSRIHNVIVPLCEDTEQKQEQKRDQSAETATEATEDPQQEARKPPSFTQLLKLFEDNFSNISQFLDPLGINVTVMTDDDASKNTPKSPDCSNRNEAEQKPPTSPDETKKFPGKGKKLRDDKKDESSSSINNESAQKTVQPEMIIEDNEWTVLPPEIPHSRSSSMSSSGNGAIPKQVTPTAPPTTEPEKEPKQNIYPSLMEQQQFFHPNPKIQQAVEAMMSMGFSNEGGWLTQLLVSKDGDIGKALDVLAPARPS